ncbi:hypothetical protein BSKO_00929 [Bryopsis sp. KO-2023]|nr:hypothetical protein BSKO_00929 [Bryopsis sp. KO-2023]
MSTFFGASPCTRPLGRSIFSPLASKPRQCRRSLRVQANIFEDFSKWKSEMRQNARIARLEARDKQENFKKKIVTQPAVASMMSFFSAVRKAMDPLFRIIEFLQISIIRFAAGYDNFALDECKRMWRWKRENEEEIKFWLGVLAFIRGLLLTCLYQFFVPSSVLRAIVVPMSVGFFLCDRFLTSPQALAVYLTAPLKFYMTGWQFIWY